MTSSESTTRVLLVEDSKINRELLKRRLDRRGFDVDVAEDGLRGFEMALELDPDVVLMDMSLPVLDGWRATARLRANAFDQPIIGLTAHALTSDRERAMNAGCTDFITKPVDFEHLVASIARLTSGAPTVATPRQTSPAPMPVRDGVPTGVAMASAGLCAAHAHDIGGGLEPPSSRSSMRAEATESKSRPPGTPTPRLRRWQRGGAKTVSPTFSIPLGPSIWTLLPRPSPSVSTFPRRPSRADPFEATRPLWRP